MWLTDPRKCVVLIVCLFLATAAPNFAAAQKTWNKIRYQAGTVQVKVNPFDWNTTLRISDRNIELNFESRKRIVIRAQDVIALSYGETAFRRVSGLLSSRENTRPVPLFGILHNDRDHLVGLEFRNNDGSPGGLLLMVHKDNYHDLLRNLSELTGKRVEGAP